MKIVIKMPTGKFLTDNTKEKKNILDEDGNTIPILVDKEFEAPFISSRKLKRTVILGKVMEADSENENTFDRMADYISDIYGRQFTKDNVLDGLAAILLIENFTACMSAVTGELSNKVSQLTSGPNA